MDYLTQAKIFDALKLKAVPCERESKRPLKHPGWRDLITTDIITADYGTPDAIAVLCGSLSKNLFCIDFDLKNGDGIDFFEDYMNLLENDNPFLYQQMVCGRTQSGGYHIYGYAPQPGGSKKLARTDKKKDLIEIRGEGGYCVVPPTEGYQFIRGSLESIPTLTQQEYEYLQALAKCFDEYVPEDIPEYVPKGGQIAGDSPLNRYDNETDPCQILKDLGYRQIRGNSTQIHFNRPNARNRNGTDATVYLDKKHIHFWSPVSNAVLPDTDRNYKPSQFLVFTRYNGDFQAAAKDLAANYKMELPIENSISQSKPVVPKSIAEDNIEPEITPTIIIENPAEASERRIHKYRIEAFAEPKLRDGVNLTEVLLTEAYESLHLIDKDFIREELIKFYKDNEDLFGINKIKNGFEKFEKWMLASFVIRRNVVNFSTQILHKRNLEATGYDENSIYNLAKKLGYKATMQDVKAFLADTRYIVRYDPIAEYFENLDKNHIVQNPDAIAHLASFVSVADEHKDFWPTMLRKALIRSVAAGIGGYVNREAIVLCDPKERAGKTSFIRFINPWGVKQYFCAEVIINNKDQMFRIAQNFVYLIDEIGSERYNRKVMDFLKVILSKESVNDRKVYGIDPIFMERKVNFWGTTNLPYLQEGENTRWISIPITAINHDYHNYITGKSEVNIDDVWKEAYDAYRAGEPYELTPQERDIQESINKDWIVGNEAINIIDSYCHHAGGSWKTIGEIMKLLDVSNSNLARRISANGLLQAFKSRGFDVRKVMGDNGYKIEQVFVNVK
jgi:hypothetical protein